MSAVGFVGAGQMGEPMVERLLAAGHQVTVHARRPEVRERLAAAGAAVVDTPRDAAADAEIALACVFSDEQLERVADGEDGLIAGLRPGAVFASHTTGRIATLARLSQAASRRRAHVVDAPVSGTDTDIRAGRLTVLLGGEAAAVERCGLVLAAYAEPLVPTGPLGSALAVKLINNLMFAAHAQIATEAVRLGGQLGVEQALLLGAIAACSGSSRAASYVASRSTEASFAERAASYLRKDVAACEAELAASGLDAGLLGQVVRSGPLDLAPGGAG
jgi:3-hydroxyisobutyrate dehydrogenase-like beta-hydroxyacid dehydrogenase